MNILGNEFCKLFSKKAAWILLLLIVVNPLTLLYIINIPGEDGYTIKEYSSVYKEIEGLNESDALSCIENGINEAQSYGMMSLYSRVYSEAETVFLYGEYLDEIDKKAEDIAVMQRFSGNGGYAAENAEKTRDVYQKLKGLTPEPADPSLVFCVTDIGVTDYILILIIFILAVSIVFQEKDRDQFQLLRTMKRGRSSLMLSKSLLMIILIVIMTVILYGSNFIVAAANFGTPDYNSPIQSIYLYRSSPFDLNVGSFLLCFLAVKILANILIGQLFLVICSAFDRIVYVFMSGAVLIFAEMLLYEKIPQISYLVPLKYINIIYGIKSSDIFSDYININVLGHPVNTVLLYGIMWAVLAFASVIYIKNYLDFSREKRQMNFSGLKLAGFIGRHTSVFLHESYKLLVSGRALFILILFSGFVIWWNPPVKITFDSIDEVYYKEYLDGLYGPLDDDSYRRINEEKKIYDDISNEIQAEIEQGKSIEYIGVKYKDELERQDAFDKLMSHLSYLESQGGGWLFYDKGFAVLTDTKRHENRDVSQAFVYIIILIALTCGIYGMDYNNSEILLLKTTANGRRRINVIKGVLGALSIVVSFVLIYIVRLVDVLKVYGTKGLGAPAASMEHLSAIPQGLSVLQYFLIIMAMRFIAGIIIVLAVFFLTRLLKNSAYAIALCVLIFILPLSLVLLKVPNAEYILLNPLLIGNVF